MPQISRFSPTRSPQCPAGSSQPAASGQRAKRSPCRQRRTQRRSYTLVVAGALSRLQPRPRPAGGSSEVANNCTGSTCSRRYRKGKVALAIAQPREPFASGRALCPGSALGLPRPPPPGGSLGVRGGGRASAPRPCLGQQPWLALAFSSVRTQVSGGPGRLQE